MIRSLANSTVGQHKTSTSYLALFDLDGHGVFDSYDNFISGDSYSEVHAAVADRYNSIENLIGCPTLYIDPVFKSEQKKYVLPLREGFGHFLLNTLAVAFHIHENDPDAVVIIVTGNGDVPSEQWESSPRRKYLEFLDEVLSLHGISYYFAKSSYSTFDGNTQSSRSKLYEKLEIAPVVGKIVLHPIYEIKNAVVLDDYKTTMNLSLFDILKYLETYVLCSLPAPENGPKKVYISRGGNVITRHSTEKSEDGSLGYIDADIRIYNEAKLEEYLRSVGFEIVYPYDLLSVYDQCAMMRGASILIGATGTGLVNVLLMESCKTVI
jgi:hypothetical protein